jgi:cell division protein FtsB
VSDFNSELVIDLFKQRDELRADNERLTRKVAELYEGAEEQRQRIHLLIAERDTARGVADQKWNLRRKFESLLGTSDITTAIGIVKTLIQASKDNAELRQQLKEQKARIKRLAQSCVAKDEQICNLLEICRSNGIEVSSQDLINGREGK